MKLYEMTNMFIDSRKRGTDGARKRCGSKTIEIYKRNLAVWETFCSQNEILDYQNVKRGNILSLIDWVDALVWADATRIQFWRVMRSYFKWVERDEECVEEGLKSHLKYMPAVRKTPRREYIPSAAELRSFRNAFQTHKPYALRNYVAFCLMLDTGIRVGELVGIKLHDLMLEESKILVDGKTGRRLVPVTAMTAKLIKTWIRARARTTMGPQSSYLFISKYQEKINENGIRQAFTKIKNKHGFKNITPHTLRHSFCTYYLQHGGSMERLRNITGHTTYGMLQDYLHLAQTGTKEALEELERVSVLKNL